MSVTETLQPYLGAEPYAFVCYDYANAEALARDVAPLVGAGVRCFFDETSRTGSRWSDDFAARLLAARLFILFIADQNAATERTRRELSFAIDAKIPVIAVKLDDSDTPPGIRLLLASETVLNYVHLQAGEVPAKLTSHLQQAGFDSVFVQQDAETVFAQLDQLGPGDLLVDRFQLLERIGKGGMSFVYKAKDTETYGEPTVAVKIINPKFAAHPDSLVTLKRETAKTQILNHPNIVNVRDFRNDGPIAFMWMEFLEGESLSERLKRQQKISAEEVDLILRGISDGLDHAHKKGIVHADFKPGNVMLTASPVTDPGQVRLIDFGIALAYRSDQDNTKTDTIFDPAKLGAYTPEYASPELIGREVGAHPSDDVYALACITYEMITGRHPFGRTSAELAGQANLRVQEDPALTPTQLDAIRHGLMFKRGERTPNVMAFYAEFSGGSSRRPRRPSGETRVNEDLDATVFSDAASGDETIFALDQDEDADSTAGTRRRSLIVGAVAAGVIAGVVALVSLTMDVPWRSDQPDSAAGNPASAASSQADGQFADCAGCPLMLPVSPAAYRQGNDAAKLSSETPQRQINFAHGFAVSAAEVTVAEFRAYARAVDASLSGCEIYRDGTWVSDTNASWQQPGFAQTDDHPVVCVSWDDAQQFVAWLSRQAQADYRLLSASEWEFLARRDYAADNLCTTANIADQTALQRHPGWVSADCEDGAVYTRATFPRDGGLQNLLGNVFEWVADCWNTSYRNAPVDGRAWLEGDCSRRELRGGSWYTQPEFVSPTFRNHLPRDTRTSTIGFRVARDMEEQER